MNTMANKVPEQLAQIAKVVHRTAIEKGWWGNADPDLHGPELMATRNLGELLFLAISELAEAHEVARMPDFDPKRVWFGGSDGKKPEGFSIELADFVIRLLDNLEAGCLNVANAIEYAVTVVKVDILANQITPELKRSTRPLPDNIGEACMAISNELALAYSRPSLLAGYAGMAIYKTYQLAQGCGFDLIEAIHTKHEYNLTRPFRHGNKLA